MDKIINVNFEFGGGKASIVSVREDRVDLFEKLFRCQLHGTVNFREVSTVKKGNVNPCIVDGIHRFYLVGLRHKESNDTEFGWMYKWDGSKQKDDVHEIYFKKIIDDKFKSDDIEMTIYDKWSKQKVSDWQKGKYWFQTFDWASLESVRADSRLVWDKMRKEDYSNKTVLDFGCNYGFHSFSAAKLGAIVTGIELKASDLIMAEDIRHIEMTDAKFINDNKYPDEKFDYIFDLSVYHWICPDYSELPEHMEMLKSKGKIIYLELINPPLRGGLTQQEVDDIVGGEKLVHYQHKVRKMRTLYRIEGY